MSSLLEQAIIDAGALKEAAIKNAESAVIEKYAPDIRRAVETLLEQEDDLGLGLDGMEDPMAAALPDDTAGGELGDSEALEDMPMSGAPESESDVIELDMEKLSALVKKLTDDEMGDPMSHEVAGAGEGPQAGTPPSLPDTEVSPVAVTATLEEDQEIDIDELLEELIVDIDPKSIGTGKFTPDAILDYQEQLKLAQIAGTAKQEELKDLRSAVDRLAEGRKQLVSTNKKLLRTVRSLQEKFDQVNLSNARLLYTNRVLTNNSLNERQKMKIVESLSSAGSLEEAKVIFETLQSAVGSIHQKKQPKSLREALQRNSSVSLRREPREVESPEVSRMQILAGIKNK